jgi:hypothetical protein
MGRVNGKNEKEVINDAPTTMDRHNKENTLKE